MQKKVKKIIQAAKSYFKDMIVEEIEQMNRFYNLLNC